MKRRTELGPGRKATERGSSFANPRSELRRTSELERVSTRSGGNRRRSTLSRGRGFSASKAQQEKARNEPCVVTQQEALYGAVIDPAHLCARAQGGCNSALCVVPLRRDLHERLDDPGDPFDLLPYLAERRVPELQHALGHYKGDLIALLQRLTGQRYAPIEGLTA